MTVIDCPGLTPGRQGYALVTTHSVHNYIIRTVVDIDTSHPSQSRIYAEIWNPVTLTWNRTVTREGVNYAPMPHCSWFAGAPKPAQIEAATKACGEIDQDMLVYTIGLLDVRP